MSEGSPPTICQIFFWLVQSASADAWCKAIKGVEENPKNCKAICGLQKIEFVKKI